MNSWILKIAKPFTKTLLYTAMVMVLAPSVWALEVDVSRRLKAQNAPTPTELRWPASSDSVEELFSETPVNEIFNSVEPAQSIVVLHTEEGFLPETIRVRKDGNYKIIVVNVNEKFKNASFMLDAFGQTLGTYFGKPKQFSLVPKVNGIFTFISAETGFQGKIIVFGDKDSAGSVSVSHRK